MKKQLLSLALLICMSSSCATHDAEEKEPFLHSPAEHTAHAIEMSPMQDAAAHEQLNDNAAHDDNEAEEPERITANADPVLNLLGFITTLGFPVYLIGTYVGSLIKCHLL